MKVWGDPIDCLFAGGHKPREDEPTRCAVCNQSWAKKPKPG
jgi:hypothetical protein